MGRRSYTERQLVVIARTAVQAVLPANRVTKLPPTMHAVVGASGSASRLGGVFIGIDSGVMDPLDGRKNNATATEYPCTWSIRAMVVDPIAQVDPGGAYLDHLDDVRRVSGALSQMFDTADPPERVPVQQVRHVTEWEQGQGEFIVTVVTATVLARAPLTVS